jgi:hypothetical protein
VQLSAEHQALCKKTLKFLHDLAPEVEKLKRAGIDTSVWEQLRSRLIDVSQAIAKDFCGVKHPV